jgi:hypothetical protein
MSPFAGRLLVASATVGKNPVESSQTIAAVAINARMDWTTISRSSEARANAATPRGVTGSQANLDSMLTLTQKV